MQLEEAFQEEEAEERLEDVAALETEAVVAHQEAPEAAVSRPAEDLREAVSAREVEGLAEVEDRTERRHSLQRWAPGVLMEVLQYPKRGGLLGTFIT